jgi:hypothetical protein
MLIVEWLGAAFRGRLRAKEKSRDHHRRMRTCVPRGGRARVHLPILAQIAPEVAGL